MEKERQERGEQRKREMELQKERLRKLNVSKPSAAASPLEELLGKQLPSSPATSSTRKTASTSSDQKAGAESIAAATAVDQTATSDASVGGAPSTTPPLLPPQSTAPTPTPGEGNREAKYVRSCQ